MKKPTLENIFGKNRAKDIRAINESIYNAESSRKFLEAASQIVGAKKAQSILEAQNILLEELQHVTYHGGRGWERRTGNRPQGAFPQHFGYNQRAIDRSTMGYQPEYVRTMHDHDYGRGGQWGPPPAEPSVSYRQPPERSYEVRDMSAPRAVRQQGFVPYEQYVSLTEVPAPSSVKDDRQARMKAQGEERRKKLIAERDARIAAQKKAEEQRRADLALLRANNMASETPVKEPISGETKIQSQKEETKVQSKKVGKKSSKPVAKKTAVTKIDYEKDFKPANGQGCPVGFPYTIHVSSFNSDHKDGAEKRARMIADSGVQGVYFYQLDGQGKNSKRVNVWRVRVGYFRTKEAAAKFAKEEVEPVTKLKRFVQSDRTKPEGKKGWWIDNCANDKYVANTMFALNAPDIHADGVNAETAKATLVCPDGSAPVASGAAPATATPATAAPAVVPEQHIVDMTDAEVKNAGEEIISSGRSNNSYQKPESLLTGIQEFNNELHNLIAKSSNLFPSSNYPENNTQSDMTHYYAIENKANVFAIAKDDDIAVVKMKKYFIKMLYKFTQFNAFCDKLKKSSTIKLWEELYDTTGMSSLEFHRIISDMADEIDDAVEHFTDYMNGNAQGIVDDSDEDFYQCLRQFSEEIENVYESLEDALVNELNDRDVSDAVQKLKKAYGTKADKIKTGKDACEFLRGELLSTYDMWPFYSDGNVASHTSKPFPASYINSPREASDNVRLHDDNMYYVSIGSSTLMNETDMNTLKNQIASHNSNTTQEEMQSETNKFIVSHATDLNKVLSGLQQYIDKQTFDEVSNDETESTKKYVNLLLAADDTSRKEFSQFIANIENAMNKHKQTYTKAVVNANGWKTTVYAMEKVKKTTISEIKAILQAPIFNSVNLILKLKVLLLQLKKIDEIKTMDAYRIKSEAELKAEQERKAPQPEAQPSAPQVQPGSF